MPTQTVPKRKHLSRTASQGTKRSWKFVKSRITKGQAQTHAAAVSVAFAKSPKTCRDLSLGLELYRNAAIQNLSNLINPGAKIRAAVCCTIWLSRALGRQRDRAKVTKETDQKCTATPGWQSLSRKTPSGAITFWNLILKIWSSGVASYGPAKPELIWKNTCTSA